MSKLENVGGMPAEFAGFGEADDFRVVGVPGSEATLSNGMDCPVSPSNAPHQFANGSATWALKSGDSSMRGANILTAADHNRKIILQALRSRRDMTSSELAGVVGLSPPAVFKIVRKLSDEGWITRSRAAAKGRGQPTHKLNLNPHAAFSLGLHIDTDRLTLVALDFVGQLRQRMEFSIAFAGPAQVRFFVATAISELRARTFGGRSRITGMGLALPDELASLELRVQTAWHKKWGLRDPAEVLQGIVDAPIVVDTEGASAATGEMLLGVGVEVPSFFYILVGDKLSGGLVINNRYIRGARGRGAEIGLFPQIAADRESAPRGASSEAVLLPALLKDLSDLGQTGPDLQFLDNLHGESQQVLDHWLDRVADSLYFPLFAVVCAVDPNAVVIGGPLPARTLLALCSKIRVHFLENAGAYWQQMMIKPAAVGTDPAAIGAALQAFPDLWASHMPWTMAGSAIAG